MNVEKITTVFEEIFTKYGFSLEDSKLITKILIDADLRGITSHGVQRLTLYDKKLQSKYVLPRNKWKILKQTKTSLLIDANQTMGQLVSNFTMEQLIKKAKDSGIAVGVVRNSNHFGAAGYYARMAAQNDLIGIASTDTNPLLVPPKANKPFLGSNPLAFAFPTTSGSFVFDAATSTVSLGKIEVLLKNDQKIPGQWAINQDGVQEDDPKTVLDELSQNNRVGGILPLGGLSEDNSNYKGFGNSLIIECLTSILAQGSISADLGNKNHDISHFFLVIDPDLFGEREKIEQKLSDMLNRIRALGERTTDPVVIPGDKEIQNLKINQKKGIVVDDKTLNEINKIATRLGVTKLATA